VRILRGRLRALTPLLIVVAAVAIEAVLAPSPADTLDAMAMLGPLDGWRCVHEATYSYEPRWPRLPGGVLTEPPEQVLHDVEVTSVEVNLRSGEAVVWTRPAVEEQRVYVLAPGRMTAIGQSCVGHLAAWQIIGEHSLR
jgi:hypothetical protein